MNLSSETLPVPYHETFDITDPSKLQTFMGCPRQYFYEYVLAWRSAAPNNHLVFGEAWHAALEHLLLTSYEPANILEAYEKFLAIYRAEFHPDTDALMRGKTPDNVFRALAAYAGKYADDLREWEVLKTETAGTVAIAPDRVLHFKMDNELRHRRTGDIASLEHKTASMDMMWDMQWPLKMQVGCYTHCLFCTHYAEAEKVKGLIMNVVFFYQNEKTPFKMRRVPAYRTLEHMRVWLNTANFWYSAMEREWEELSRASENDHVMNAFPLNGENCTKYGGCSYHDFCTSWSNPLQKAFAPPLGMKVDRWDPSRQDAANKVELTMEG